MAVRVRLRIRGPKGKTVETVAILNGGFEVPIPQLLLPARCANKLLGKYHSMVVRQEMQAATGRGVFLSLLAPVRAAVVTADRTGIEGEYRVLIGEGEDEVLVSDTGIDALGVRIESFAPGRWRFTDESTIRVSEVGQQWFVPVTPTRRKRK